MCLEIRKPNSKPFVIVTWYRPPNSPNEVFSSLENLANEMPSAANGEKSCLKYLNTTDQRFCVTPQNSSQVFSQLNRIKLSNSKAIGLDKISARLIRECADLFAFLFARSLIVL